MSAVIAPIVGDSGDELPPLSKDAAKALDKKIRTTADKAANNIRALLDLLEQATTGQAYVGLGYPSAGAYIFDAVQIAPADTAQRKLLAALISDRRLTPKTITEALGGRS